MQLSGPICENNDEVRPAGERVSQSVLPELLKLRLLKLIFGQKPNLPQTRRITRLLSKAVVAVCRVNVLNLLRAKAVAL